MRDRRPELRAVTVTILLGTLALALAVVIGYAWWSSQRHLAPDAQEKVDLVFQFLVDGMALLPAEGGDDEVLHTLLGQVGQQVGVRHLEIVRGAGVTRQFGQAQSFREPDEPAQRALQTGESVSVVETSDGQQTIRYFEVLRASPECMHCHDAAPGEILGVIDVAFPVAQARSFGPDFYWNLVLVSLLVGVITVLLVVLTFSRINMARRIESVASLAGDIAAGGRSRRVDSLPGTGMDGLARTINDMARSLQAHEEALNRQQSELEDANRRLELLVQESHHRIKNNLQTVADLLFLQSADCRAEGGACLTDSIQRIKSIAAVHELLSAGQTESADIKKLAERLAAMSIRSAAPASQQITHQVEGDTLYLPSKHATALALVLTELFNNALLHGLANSPGGALTLAIDCHDGRTRLEIRDSGAGLPQGFLWRRDERLGLRLVRTLAERELSGECSLESGTDGTIATVSFPLPSSEGPAQGETQ